MSPLEGVWRTIQRYDLLPRGTRVAAAVSGGGDSVALLSVLLELAPRGGFSVVGLIHVNHQLRGADSERDDAFCRALAERFEIAVHVERIDVRGAAAADGRSVEDAARRARYAALERGRQALGADRVAVGHTRDDQAETVLLKLLRGAGPRGLAGIYPRKGPVVRPLIDVARQQLRAWLADNGMEHVEDASNEDVSNPRNLMRHEVLPALQRWVGPSVLAALARTAEIARAEDDFLAELASSLFGRSATRDGDRLQIDAGTVASMPLALKRRVLHEALRAGGVREPGFAEVEALRSLVEAKAGRIDLPGQVRADRNATSVVLSGRGATTAAGGPAFWYALPVPGRVWVAEARATVEADRGCPDGQLPGSTAELPVIAVAGARVADGLFVRNWRPGDALRPVGLSGTKKLQDLFVDRKVPRSARHRFPLVVDGGDHVVWVPGLAVDEGYQASVGGSGVVVLKLTREWGGPE